VLPAALAQARKLNLASPAAQQHTAGWVQELDAIGQHGLAALATSRSLVGLPEQQTMLRAALRARKEPRP